MRRRAGASPEGEGVRPRGVRRRDAAARTNAPLGSSLIRANARRPGRRAWRSRAPLRRGGADHSGSSPKIAARAARTAVASRAGLGAHSSESSDARKGVAARRSSPSRRSRTRASGESPRSDANATRDAVAASRESHADDHSEKETRVSSSSAFDVDVARASSREPRRPPLVLRRGRSEAFALVFAATSNARSAAAASECSSPENENASRTICETRDASPRAATSGRPFDGDAEAPRVRPRPVRPRPRKNRRPRPERRRSRRRS